MRGINHWLTHSVIAWWLVLNLTGCAQTPMVITDDGGNYLRPEELGLPTEPSANPTNLGIWISSQGGG